MEGVRLGVDVGGTFTDLVALAGNEIVTAKVPSTPERSDGVLRAVEAGEVEGADVSVLAHGTTVATNALLERRGARTALVTTDGFRDVIEIGRQDRPSLYDLTVDRPPPLVSRELRFTVLERTGPEGVLVPLDEGSLAACVEQVAAAAPEAVAVCLLFGYLHPGHEQRVADALRAALPDVRVVCSHEVLPEFREYERFSTTVADAYLGPALGAYLSRLSEAAASAGLPRPLVMQSSGGVVPIDLAVEQAAGCVLSGPAGGVVGAARVARESGHTNVLSFDMGGTSTDVAAIVDGRARTTTEGVVGGVPIKLPMVDVHTIGAGGGSIAWVDEGDALRVGPRSAGAEPGPACYGRGGEEPTVTDANLLLGYLEDGAVLGGEVTLSRAEAERALGVLGARLGMDAIEVALGTIRVAEAEMARALRVISVERGLDPRDFALAAFGGAGPLHACALAEELGIPTVLVPKASGVLSALGLALSDLRRDHVAPFLSPGDEVDPARMKATFSALEQRARTELPDARCERSADLRYAGQSFELTVGLQEPDQAVERFHGAHEARYGYRIDAERVEFVNLRVAATVPVQADVPKELNIGSAHAVKRSVLVDGSWIELDTFRRLGLGAGAPVAGPALVDLGEATCFVRPGWGGAVDFVGTLVLERNG